MLQIAGSRRWEAGMCKQKMYSHVFSVLFLVNLMIINSSLKSQNYVVDDRNAFKSYDKMYISNLFEMIQTHSFHT